MNWFYLASAVTAFVGGNVVCISTNGRAPRWVVTVRYRERPSAGGHAGPPLHGFMRGSLDIVGADLCVRPPVLLKGLHVRRVKDAAPYEGF